MRKKEGKIKEEKERMNTLLILYGDTKVILVILFICLFIKPSPRLN
jgi:hypothetical protein